MLTLSFSKTGKSHCHYNFMMRLLILFLLCFNIFGCQALKPESIYEGIRSQQKSNNVGKDMPKQTLPSYGEYEKERKSTNGQ